MADARTILEILVTAKDEAGPVFKGVAAGGVAALGLIGAAALGIGNDVQGATNTLQTQLGIAKDEAKELGEVAKAVYKNNFAGSVTDAAAVVAESFRIIGDVGEAELQRITENALRLQDAGFGETKETIDAAKTLMENFGLSSDEAFDLITAGFQKGLDRSGDFLDTIGEYSVQFKNGGATAEQFFSLLESGLQGGMLGTDKAADAFKEFQVRIMDGSTATRNGLRDLGIDHDQFVGNIANGNMSVAQAFSFITQALAETDDKALQMQAGVSLIGTQFEDLGAQGATALSMLGTSFSDAEGAASTLDAQYNTLGSTIESYKRRALLALLPVTEAMSGALPVIGDMGMALTGLGPIAAGMGGAFKMAATVAVPALRAIGLAMLTPPVGIVVALVAAGVAVYLFRDQIIDGIGAAKDFVVGAMTSVANFLTENWQDILAVASLFLLGPAGLVVLFSTNAFGIRDTFNGAIDGIVEYLKGLPGKLFALAKEAGKALLDGLESIPGVKAALEVVGFYGDVAGKAAGVASKAADWIGFDNGGVVPGRIGEPRVVVAHGGETILPTHKSQSAGGAGMGGNVIVQIDKVYARDEREARRAGNDIGWALMVRGASVV